MVVRRDRFEFDGVFATTLDAAQILAVTGRPGRAGHLPDGRPCFWLDDDQRRALDQIGEETYDTRGLLCLLLLDVLPRYAAELLDNERICDVVTASGVDPLQSGAAFSTISVLLRRLVADGLPIAGLGALFNSIDGADPPPLDVTYEEIRSRLGPRMYPDLQRIRRTCALCRCRRIISPSS